MFQRLLVLALLLVAGAASAQRVLTTPDFTSFTGHDGFLSPGVLKAVPLPDGSMIMVGQFDVWYEGQRFRDLLKLKPNGDPDTSWRVDISYQDNVLGYVRDAILTPTGLFIAAVDSVLINGTKAPTVPYVSLSTGQLLNPTAVASTSSGYDVISNYDRSTGYVYVYSQEILRRVSALTGEVDNVWKYMRTPAQNGQTNPAVSRLTADSKGGLWMGLRSDTDFYRISNALPAPGDTVAYWRSQFTLPNETAREVTRDYIYTTNNRYGADGVRDGSWKVSGSPLGWSATDKNLYLFSGAGLTRAPLSGNGAIDSWSLPLPQGYSFEGSPVPILIPSRTSIDDDGVAALVYKPSYVPVDSKVPDYSTVFMVKDDGVAEPNPTVVEYYVPALKHYFLTGRKNEQDTLDALPQSFTRTGMKFAAKSSRYRDIAEQPVCRLYASPEKGLSNSHFYGIGADCPTLNKLSGLKYEGYDFSVLKPTSTGCTADAPNAVTRLFNNRAASNDSNHRYVVSAATKAKMLAQGWLDEGAVFCSASVIDAVN